MKRIGRYEYKGYKLNESEIVNTRITNQINRILRVRELQGKGIGHCEYEGSKCDESDITSTRVTSEMTWTL